MPRLARRSGRQSRRSALETLFEDAGSRAIRQRQQLLPLLRHGAPARLDALGSLEEFSDFRRWVKQPGLAISATLDVRGKYRKLSVDPVQAAHLYAIGATLTFTGVEDRHPALSRMLGSLAAELGIRKSLCHCNVYLSPAGGGVPKHFDAHDLVIVQVIGRKTWTLAANKNVRNPTDNVVATRPVPKEVARQLRGKISRAMPRGNTKVELRAGSALFVPAGHWHATRAREASLSLTFGLVAPTFAELLSRRLAVRLRQLPQWREMSWGAHGTPAQRAAIERRLDALLTELDPSVLRFSASSVLDEE